MDTNILTVSGNHFNFLNPAMSRFDITDIAHALSHVCRFTGHTKSFYSVAQHSVLVSFLVPEDQAMAGLLHDAAEAFCGDVSSPLKQLLPDYKAIENQVEQEIFRRFGTPITISAEVKRADLIALATERRDLMPHTEDAWACLQGISPMLAKIKPWASGCAKERFLARFDELVANGSVFARVAA